MNNYDNSIKNDCLRIGGISAAELREKFGTPLYVFDEDKIRHMCGLYLRSLEKYYGKSRVSYASKAFCAKGIYKIIDSENLCCDVVSEGELLTAKSVNFPADKIYFHGNNKSLIEITDAVSYGVHAIVIDSTTEAEEINAVAEKFGKVQSVLVRVNPGVEAHTHIAVQTGVQDSKFGVSIVSDDAYELIKHILKLKNIKLIGLHIHIGSQIFDIAPYLHAIEKLTDFMKKLNDELSVSLTEMNIGGGFGITYTDKDKVFTDEVYNEFLSKISEFTTSEINKRGLNKPVLVIEPGRSIVGAAGTTLYTVGTIKDIPNKRKYVAIDGGMFDNPRYALYQAEYTATVVNRFSEPKTEKVTIAGKCCESGDLIIKDAIIQKDCKKGDIIAVFGTGAYNYSMASNYNRNLIPPVVLVKDGQAEYLVKPQTYEQLMQNDVIPERLK